MTIRKDAPRLSRSREAMLDAFRVLLIERGYEKMTVQHVLNRAHVGRATFYAHFRNKRDLLDSSLDRLQNALRLAWRNEISRSRSADTVFGFSREFFRHVDGHRRIYDLIVGRPSEVTIERSMRGILCNLVREDFVARLGTRRASKHIEPAVQYFGGALWSLMVWWISTRAPITADDLDARFHALAAPSVKASLA